MSDDECIKYKRRPILTQDERVTAISFCKLVDKAIPVFGPPDAALFEEHKIDVVCHGSDIDESTKISWYGEAIKRNMYVETPYERSISTTEIIKRVKER